MARKTNDVNGPLKYSLKARLDLTLDENTLCTQITDLYFAYVVEKDAVKKKKNLSDLLSFLLDTKFISESTRDASLSEDEKTRSVATQRWSRSVVYNLRDYCQDRNATTVRGDVVHQEWERKWTKVAKGTGFEERLSSSSTQAAPAQYDNGHEAGVLAHQRKRQARSVLDLNGDEKPSLLAIRSPTEDSGDDMQVGAEASMDFSATAHPELYRSTFVDTLKETRLRLETLSLRLTCMRQCREEGVVCPDFVTSGMRFKKRLPEGSKED